MFNVVSTCSYGFTMDNVKVEKVWEMEDAELRKQKIDDLEIANEKKNFMLLPFPRFPREQEQIPGNESVKISRGIPAGILRVASLYSMGHTYKKQ